MQKVLRSRMRLPVAETLHITRVLLQLVRGVLAGNNQQKQGRNDRTWTKHVFAARPKVAASGARMRAIAFAR
eukprot:1174014-Alexandrium_andersonii.AAC.1